MLSTFTPFVFASSGFEFSFNGATPSSLGGKRTLDVLGCAREEEMMAGSTGAPATVECPVGALLAGGVYRFELEDVRGVNWRATPLYLRRAS